MNFVKFNYQPFIKIRGLYGIIKLFLFGSIAIAIGSCEPVDPEPPSDQYDCVDKCINGSRIYSQHNRSNVPCECDCDQGWKSDFCDQAIPQPTPVAYRITCIEFANIPFCNSSGVPYDNTGNTSDRPDVLVFLEKSNGDKIGGHAIYENALSFDHPWNCEYNLNFIVPVNMRFELRLKDSDDGYQPDDAPANMFTFTFKEKVFSFQSNTFSFTAKTSSWCSQNKNDLKITVKYELVY